MPPKRKAASSNTDLPRTRTRSAAATTVEETLIELPPAKRTRRRANEEPAVEEVNAEEAVAESSTGRKRATRATAKRTEPEAADDALNQPQTRASRMKGKTIKQDEKATEAEKHEPEKPEQPQTRVSRMPGKKQSEEETEEPQASEPPSPRPSRTRATQARGKLNKKDVEQDPQPGRSYSRPLSPVPEAVAKKRGRTAKSPRWSQSPKARSRKRLIKVRNPRHLRIHGRRTRECEGSQRRRLQKYQVVIRHHQLRRASLRSGGGQSRPKLWLNPNPNPNMNSKPTPRRRPNPRLVRRLKARDPNGRVSPGPPRMQKRKRLVKVRNPQHLRSHRRGARECEGSRERRRRKNQMVSRRHQL
ncbi:hypothetical protein C8Q80DRAFT_301462 [Daedaleopsis nitida]|nr:hypothetical protein C8Q80DRAFT_301462 [Daedaleopsis nitida]